MATGTKTKTADFAQLFDLFERLASRRARASNAAQDLPGVPIPPELEPVIANLATIVGAHKARKPYSREFESGISTSINPSTTTTTTAAGAARPRRSTVAGSTGSSRFVNQDTDSSDDEVSLAKFPLGKKYPFTFRLMLHKLYGLDDWAKKVQQVLEKSQMEYKPLAEKTRMEEDELLDNDREGQPGRADQFDNVHDGHLHFVIGTSGGKRGAGRSTVRQRSHSVASVDIGKTSGTSGTSVMKHVSDGTRILKKRCVGRRKSMNGPLGTEPGRIGGSWVYDAAISRQEDRPRVSFEPAAESSTPSVRARYQSLGSGRKMPGGMKRRLSTGAPGDFPHFTTQAGNKTERVLARKRALTIANSKDPHAVKRNNMKCPFTP